MKEIKTYLGDRKINLSEEKINLNTERKWYYCNGKLKPCPNEWSYGSHIYPQCGSTSGMVNALGGCSTKIYLD